MLDKLLFNNQLFTNKKNVQRAKINTISRMVQKIKKLKTLKETDPDNEKISKKYLKSINILNCLKKCKSVDVLKRAILNMKNPMSVVTNSKSTIEEIADALLFNHKIIKEIVKHFKQIFNLNDTNPEWRNDIQELSKKQKKSLRTEEKKLKRQERKNKNELERKRNEWLEENCPESIKLIQQNDENLKHENIEGKNNVSNDDREVENMTRNIVKPKLNKENSQKRIIKNNEIKVNEMEWKNEKYIDPFFITQTGENYVSSVVVNRKQSDENDDNIMIIRDHKSKRPKQSISNRRKIFNKNDVNENRSRFNNRKTELNDDNTNELHPSWKAKQKLHGIKEFQGRKVVFDDNNENKIVDIPVKSAPKKKTSDCNSNDNKDLHPSWAAKQKLKPSIKEFQGTKIVFDFNE